jgi:hypothetical protein
MFVPFEAFHKAASHCMIISDEVVLGPGWKQGGNRSVWVRLERLELEYKSTRPRYKEGTKHVTSKKDFCRLLKNARLLILKTSNTPTP